MPPCFSPLHGYKHQNKTPKSALSNAVSSNLDLSLVEQLLVFELLHKEDEKDVEANEASDLEPGEVRGCLGG